MTDPSTDQIRALLASEMSVSPEPHPWADVERRARLQDNVPLHARRRTGIWLAVAACTIALVGGLVLVVGSDDEPTVPAVHPDSTPPSNPTSTSLPGPTTPDEVESGWTGGLLDDLDTEALRPLQSFTDGDVVIPTAPRGWRVADSQWTNPDEAAAPGFVEWTLEVIEARPSFNAFGHVLYLTQSREPTCNNTLGCKPTGESVTINGVEWESIVVERIPEDDDQFVETTTLRATVDDRWFSLAAGAPQALDGPLLENPPIIEFLEGLRAGLPEVVTAIGEACWQCRGANAEGDPFAAGSSTAATATESDGAATTVDPRAQASNDVDAQVGRPLTGLTEGDVVVPTYIPPGLTVRESAQFHEHGNGFSEVTVSLYSADNAWANSVRLWDYLNDAGPLDPQALGDPNHPPVEIAGVTWGWNDFETARVANIGQFSVWVYLHGLDRLEAERFIEGLRAIPIEQFRGQVAEDGADGLSVIDADGEEAADIVASDDQFELTAVQVGDQVCTKLTETTVPATMTFAANCWDSTMFAESGVQDLYPLDPTDTTHLIIGVIDSTNATSVQITTPDGETAVVPTGPATKAIDGRFFLARFDLDASNGIRLDLFTIEDVSP